MAEKGGEAANCLDLEPFVCMVSTDNHGIFLKIHGVWHIMHKKGPKDRGIVRRFVHEDPTRCHSFLGVEQIE